MLANHAFDRTKPSMIVAKESVKYRGTPIPSDPFHYCQQKRSVLESLHVQTISATADRVKRKGERQLYIEWCTDSCLLDDPRSSEIYCFLCSALRLARSIEMKCSSARPRWCRKYPRIALRRVLSPLLWREGFNICKEDLLGEEAVDSIA